MSGSLVLMIKHSRENTQGMMLDAWSRGYQPKKSGEETTQMTPIKMNTRQNRTLKNESGMLKYYEVLIPVANQHECLHTESTDKEEQCTNNNNEEDEITPHLRRSDSFMMAVSSSEVSYKSCGEFAEEEKREPTSSLQKNVCEPFSSIAGRQQDDPQGVKEMRPEECLSSLNGDSADETKCRICHEGDSAEDLVSPCYCSGSVGLLHLSCLEQWLGASRLTRCELCKYEFTLKRLPRALTEFMKDPPSKKQRNNLVFDLACFVILTPITVSSAYLCTNGVRHYNRWPGSWQMSGLTVLTVCLIFVYCIWLVVAIHHHYNICKKWRKENQIVKITYISPVKCKRTLRSCSVASSKYDALNSSIATPQDNVSSHGSISDRGSQPQHSLLASPFLRPILKYSNQLQAKSWDSGLSQIAIEIDSAAQQTDSNVSQAGITAQRSVTTVSFQGGQETYV